jgi:hypothetical protein
MPVSTTLPNGTIVAQTERGSAHMRRLQSGVLFYLCSGYYPRAFYEPMVALAQHEIERHGSLVMLVDGWQLTGVDTDFREAWTAWFKRHKERFRMTLLVRTALLQMAASLANLFTGISVITTYSTVAEWELACAQDMPGFRRSIVPPA